MSQKVSDPDRKDRRGMGEPRSEPPLTKATKGT